MDSSALTDVHPIPSAQVSTGLEQVPLPEPESPFRLYKRRFVILVAMVRATHPIPYRTHKLIGLQTMLNLVAGMNWPWFGPISNNSSCRTIIIIHSLQILITPR
jgi:hypothetical protein